MGAAATRGWRSARALALAALALSLPALAAACPTCKNGLDNPEAHGFAIGIFASIIVMLSVLFGMIGFFIFKLVQSARRESAAAAAQEPPKT